MSLKIARNKLISKYVKASKLFIQILGSTSAKQYALRHVKWFKFNTVYELTMKKETMLTNPWNYMR